MCGTDDRSTRVDSPTSSPAARETPELPNAFNGSFLTRLEDRDEPAAAEEADWAGPWRLEHLAEGGVRLFRVGESTARGYQPFASFRHEPDALLTMAMIAARREAAYRLRPVPETRGYAVESRAAWGEAVGWLAVFDEDLVAGLSWAESLMRSPEALALFLEACGKVVLQRAGAILEERVGATRR